MYDGPLNAHEIKRLNMQAEIDTWEDTWDDDQEVTLLHPDYDNDGNECQNSDTSDKVNFKSQMQRLLNYAKGSPSLCSAVYLDWANNPYKVRVWARKQNQDTFTLEEIDSWWSQLEKDEIFLSPGEDANRLLKYVRQNPAWFCWVEMPDCIRVWARSVDNDLAEAA